MTAQRLPAGLYVDLAGAYRLWQQFVEPGLRQKKAVDAIDLSGLQEVRELRAAAAEYVARVRREGGTSRDIAPESSQSPKHDLSVIEVAEIFDVDRRTIYRWIEEKRVPELILAITQREPALRLDRVAVKAYAESRPKTRRAA